MMVSKVRGKFTTFSGDVKMCKCFEFTTISRNANTIPRCSSNTPSSIQ